MQALLRGGQPLPASVGTFLEPRLGRGVGDVQIHTDAAAAATAAALDARAFTIGSDIGFGEGQYAPDTADGRRLLAHEVAHVRQGNGRPDVVRRQPRTAAPQRDPNLLQPPPPTATVMDRSAFEATLRSRFGVQRIATGTEDEQRPRDGVVLPDWQAWDPGPSSPAYSSILAALEDTAASLGGVPQIREVLFFRVYYEIGANGVAVPVPSRGASFGDGHLTIYASGMTAHKALPTGRSTSSGNYPQVTIGLVHAGETAGAPVPVPTREQSIRRIITHELGHGIAEAAMEGDPQTFTQYRQAVGWTMREPAQLFDIRQPSLQITPDTWNAATWAGQPLSRYMVEGGPGEDFAEAIMAYVQEPSVLQARSPARFNFIAANRERWLPHLMRLPQIGDFPQPPRDRVPA